MRLIVLEIADGGFMGSSNLYLIEAGGKRRFEVGDQCYTLSIFIPPYR